MARQSTNAALIRVSNFDYSPLDPVAAEEARRTADRIRAKLTMALANLIEIGTDLLTVKAAMAHGQFGRWIRAEFAWTERMAQHLMNVADRFGPKSEMISDLRIGPTAAYLLAAPSTPDHARATAIARAQRGEHITATVAQDIMARAKKKARRRSGKRLSADELQSRLTKMLEQFRDRCDPMEHSALARRLKDFARIVEKDQRNRTTTEE